MALSLHDTLSIISFLIEFLEVALTWCSSTISIYLKHALSVKEIVHSLHNYLQILILGINTQDFTVHTLCGIHDLLSLEVEALHMATPCRHETIVAQLRQHQ
jgi:hypothetical protein